MINCQSLSENSNLKYNTINKFITSNNLSEFMKLMIKIAKNSNGDDESTKILLEIMKDYSFSKTIYDKLEDFLNLFFEKQYFIIFNLAPITSKTSKN